MNVLTLDPSLTAVGWCFCEVSGRDLKVLHVGRIVPPVKEASMVERVGALVEDVSHMIIERLGCVRLQQAQIVVEIPSGRVTMRHTGGGAGLAKYGFAVGAIHQMLRSLWGDRIVAVDENWTGSRSKEVRRKIAVEHYPALKRVKDPGMDISDAVALAVWWAQVGSHKAKGAE